LHSQEDFHMTIRSLLLIAAVLVVLPAMVWAGPISGFSQTDRVPDIPGMATVADLDLGSGGLARFLYLTAGPNLEMDPVFARIDAVPEPATLSLIGGGLILVALLHRKPRR
jgi:hypothetical protein